MEHSKDFDRIKSLYGEGRWTAFMVKQAVKKGVLSAWEYEEITGEAYRG